MAGVQASPPNHTEALQAIELFRGLNIDALRAIEMEAQLRRFESDAFRYFQGGPADYFHVLLEGSVKLSQLTPEGQQVILRYASPGEAFAVVAVLSAMNYPVTAQAAEDSLTLTWGRKSMKALMLRHPQLAPNALEVLLRNSITCSGQRSIWTGISRSVL
jgi:CRP-like cAMP-binding protein